MSETVNQENVATEKTFTQDEVNAFVGERLAREREKYADYEALKERPQSMIRRKRHQNQSFRKLRKEPRSWNPSSTD